MTLAQNIWLIFLNAIIIFCNVSMQIKDKDSKGANCFSRGFCVGVSGLMIVLLILNIFI
ncbi:MAG: hypothetical protein J6W35_07890 [Eubacterium sp.]|nr:hypothetical protein [Eubacterium sp.]